MAKKSNTVLFGVVAAAGIYLATRNPTDKVAGVGAIQTPNFHIIKVSFVSWTDTKGSRVKLASERFKTSKIINYNHDFNSTYEVAIDWLNRNGFNIVGKGEGKDCYYIISDTFKAI